MAVIFIVVAEYVVQCWVGKWCEVYNSIGFNHLYTLGLVELVLEHGLIKIFKRKEVIGDEDGKRGWDEE